MLPPWIKSKTKTGRAKATDQNGEASPSTVSSTPVRRSARIAAIARGHVPTPPRYRSYQPSSPSESDASSSSSLSLPSDDEDDVPQTAQSDDSDSDVQVVVSPLASRRGGRQSSRGPRASGSSPSKGKDRDILQGIRLAAQEDEYSGEWADAIRRSGKSWVSWRSGSDDEDRALISSSHPTGLPRCPTIRKPVHWAHKSFQWKRTATQASTEGGSRRHTDSPVYSQPSQTRKGGAGAKGAARVRSTG